VCPLRKLGGDQAGYEGYVDIGHSYDFSPQRRKERKERRRERRKANFIAKKTAFSLLLLLFFAFFASLR
jgi:hypothetical protein